MNRWFDDLFTRQPMMVILRGYGTARTVELACRAWDLGLYCVEVPIASPAAVPALEATAAAGRERGRIVGAGSVITTEQVSSALAAGATFTVAPGLDLEILGASTRAGLPHLPGVSTPSEIQRAKTAGVRWLKAFPATILGPAWFKAMLGPFPGTPFVATGGITPENAREYLDAGASAVAIGSALADPTQLELLAQLVA